MFFFSIVFVTYMLRSNPSSVKSLGDGLDESARPRMGRPPSFDRGTALHAAMLAFWSHGYETTSVADLTGAMGITAPSLYAAFGDKRRLFLEAVRLYAGDPEAIVKTIDDAASSRAVASEMLISAAKAYTGRSTPRGCLLASATASGSEEAADVQSEVAAIRRSIEMTLRRRIERDVAEGVLPAGTDAAALSTMTLAVIQGLSVLARDGKSRGSLIAAANAAMGCWPHPASVDRRASRAQTSCTP